MERFYCDILGFERIGGFSGHAGFDGVMLGYARCDWHLEFTSEPDAPVASAPSEEHLLVLYFDAEDFQNVRKRLSERNVPLVRPHNPYWDERGALTIEDPDGYRVVIFPGKWNA